RRGPAARRRVASKLLTSYAHETPPEGSVAYRGRALQARARVSGLPAAPLRSAHSRPLDEALLGDGVPLAHQLCHGDVDLAARERVDLQTLDDRPRAIRTRAGQSADE